MVTLCTAALNIHLLYTVRSFTSHDSECTPTTFQHSIKPQVLVKKVHILFLEEGTALLNTLWPV
jgi:hypothetical protein